VTVAGRLLLVLCILVAHLLTASAACGQADPPARRAQPSVGAEMVVPVEDELVRILTGDGFANVAVVIDGRRVAVTYENARYRDPRRALARAAELLLPRLGVGQELVLVPSVTAIPIISARFSVTERPADESPPQPIGVSLDVSDLPPDLLKRPRASSQFGRVDVVVHPWFEASFGNYDNPIASRTGIAPEVRVAIRRGLVVSGQALFTIQDDLPTGESRVRPGMITVNQTARLPRSTFVSATAGTFTGNRYGVDLELATYSQNGIWSLGAELGLTGETSYDSQRWSFSRVNAPTALVTAAARVPRYAVTLHGAAGVFLADRRGARVDITRRFGEFELGWFGVASDRGANGGAMLRVPLPQRQYGKPAPLRIRTAESFPWQYRYNGFVTGGKAFISRGMLTELDGLMNYKL